MSPRLRHLAALAAAFAPHRAASLLALVSTPTASELVEYASALARSSRKERLAALAAAFPSIAREAAADAGTHPLWQRLTREAVARSSRHAASACRTMVRTATACEHGFTTAAPQQDAGMPRVLASAC